MNHEDLGGAARSEIEVRLERLQERLEAERRARVAEEAESARLRGLVEHWQQLESAKSHFLQLASHELRTSVTVLAGYLSMFDEGSFGELPPNADRVIGVLVAKTAELNDIINDMLETARLDDGRVDLRVSEVDVVALVEQLVSDWRLLTRPGQSLSYHAPGGAELIDADPVRLRIIVSNLLSNAVKYSPLGGDISCSVLGDDSTVNITVRDRGLGIDAEAHDVLFTRFGRVVTPSTDGLPGTGLGLYIARELAEMHGGDISVVSAPGEGSEFTVVLPRRSDRGAVAAGASATAAPVAPSAGR